MQIETVKVDKVVIIISAKEMWDNAMTALTPIGRDMGSINELEGFYGQLKEIGDILLPNGHDVSDFKHLFSRGYAPLLLGAAINHFNKPNILREVLVEGNDLCVHKVEHEDIEF